MKIYDISFNQTCSNIVISQPNTCSQTSTTVSNEPTTMITNIGLTFPGRVAPLKPISTNEDNTIYGFNVVGMSEINPCFGWGCTDTLKIRGNVEICKNLHVHGHTQLVDTSVNNLEVSGNLVVHGHSQLEDVSANNVDISGNLEVFGHTRVCDLSACNVDISQNLEVFGHTQLVDTSGASIELFGPGLGTFSTYIDASNITNTNPTNKMHPMNNVFGTPPNYGLWLRANNLYIDLRETSNALGGFGMAIKLAANDEFANFRILNPSQLNSGVDYIFQVDGAGITQARDIYPWQDCSWKLGNPTKRWGYLYACNISAIDISATNLTISGNTNLTGHLTFGDASGANLTLSNNLWVDGGTIVQAFSADDAVINGLLDVYGNLSVIGTTILSDHLTFEDASGANLTITGNLWIGILNFTDGFGTNLTLTDTLLAQTVCAEHPTPTAGVLCVKDGNATGGNPNGEIVFNMDGATGVLDIGTQNVVSSNSGRINLHNNGFNDIMVILDANTNFQNEEGLIIVGDPGIGRVVISGGRNTASSKTRSIDSSGSLLANSIIHITNLPETTSISSKKDSFLCMGGVPHKDWSINDPAFMIKMVEPASVGDHFGMFSYKFGTTDPNSSIIGLRRTFSKKRMGIGRDDPSIISYSFPINIHVCDPQDWVTAGGLLLPSGLSTIPGTSPLPSWTDRDPKNTICFNSNLFINRQTGIVIDAWDWDTSTSSWAGAESALFIGKVDNNSDLRANSIVSPFKTGVQLGAGGTFGNTGCTVHGNIRNGTNGSNVYSFQTGNSHNGYVGCYASSTGWLGIPTNGTKFRGYEGHFYNLNASVLGSAVFTTLLKAFNIINKKYGYFGDDFGPSGENLTFSAVEAPRSDCIFRGQIKVGGGTPTPRRIDMDKSCSEFFNGNYPIPSHAMNSGIADAGGGLLDGTFAANFIYDPDPSANYTPTDGSSSAISDAAAVAWCQANINVQLTTMNNPYVAGGGSEAIPYEPWNLDITLTEFILNDTWIYYVQFIAPASTTYTDVNLFTTYSSSSNYTGTIGVGIYTDTPGNPGTPNVLIGGGTQIWSFIGVDMRRKHLTINVANGVTVTKNTKYWIGIAADNAQGNVFMGFHTDYNSSYGLVKRNSSGFNGAMPSPAPVNNNFADNAYWFRLTGPSSGAGGASQPIVYFYKWASETFDAPHNGLPVAGKKIYLDIYQAADGIFTISQVISWMVIASRQDKALYDDANNYLPGDLGSSFSQIRTIDNPDFGTFEKIVWNPRHYKEPPRDLSDNPIFPQ